jgi:hypothetical protein
MRFGLRVVVVIGVAAAGVVASMLVVSMATASAPRGRATSVTVPTTPGTAPTPTASVPTTTTNAPVCTLASAATTTTTGTGGCHPHIRARRSARLVVEINNARPVAGTTFRGLMFRLLSPRASASITWVECDAKIGGKRLRAQQRSFYSSGHKRVEVGCRWRIPADAGGMRLRLWTYLSGGRARSWVVHALPHVVAVGRVGSTSWLVRR